MHACQAQKDDVQASEEGSQLAAIKEAEEVTATQARTINTFRDDEIL